MVEEPDSPSAGSLGALDDGQISAVNESDVADWFDTRSPFLTVTE